MGKTGKSRHKPLAERVTTRDKSLVSGRVGVTLPAWVLQAYSSDETMVSLVEGDMVSLAEGDLAR